MLVARTKDGLGIGYGTNIDNSISAIDMKDIMLFLSLLTKENQAELSQKWSEDNKNNYEDMRQFTKEIAHQWFRQSFCQDGFCDAKDPKIDIKELKTDFKKWAIFFVEYEKYEAALLFAYWLFFSGMALVYHVDTINFSKKMKEKFSGEENTSTSLVFFKFLKSYAQAKGIPNEAKNGGGNYYETINEINNCINESKENTPTVDSQNTHDVVLAAVKDKHEMIEDCIKNHITKNRIGQIISLSFPELKDSDVNTQQNALLSVLHAGVAKFYFNQGRIDDCNMKIEMALELS